MLPRPRTIDWSEHLQFIGRFVRDPLAVGALAPSSRQLALAMVGPMGRAVSPEPYAAPAGTRPRLIVELGPGTGAFTRAIVEHLGPNDRVLGVERDPVFAAALRQRWPEVDCVCASAEALPALVNASHLGPIDHIVSGLPFALMPVDTTWRILDAVAQTLRVGGTFTTFHYVLSYRAPRAVAFRRLMTERMRSAPSARFVARNLPPAVAVTWTNLAGHPLPGD